MEQEYIITVVSENKVGLLSQITTVFTCRNVNIESLTTSESALAGIHKFTIVVRTAAETCGGAFFSIRISYASGLKSDFGWWHSGQTKSSGISAPSYT